LSSSDLHLPQRILVIRYKAIGDVLLTSVICNSLKRSFPNAQVDYLTYEISAGLYNNHPFIDRVLTITKAEQKNPLKYLLKAKKLVSRNYDIIIDAASTHKSQLISLLARITRKTPIRIGRMNKHKNRVFTHVIDESSDGKKNKLVERLAMLRPLRELGYEIVDDDQMTLDVEPQLKDEFHQVILKAGVDFTRPVFAFSVTSKRDYKKWDESYMVTLAEHCLDKHKAQLILFSGSSNESNDIRRFQQRLNNHADIYSDIETKSIVELAAVLSHCDLFVGNEGGARHISQALKIPSLAIFSPSAIKAVWLPKGSELYQGIECQDVVDVAEDIDQKIKHRDNRNTDVYQQYYKKITPQDVIGKLDSMIKYIRLNKGRST